jgi:hypothetical protein
MRAYMDLGVSAFDVKLLPVNLEDTLASMELLAAEVVPALTSGR